MTTNTKTHASMQPTKYITHNNLILTRLLLAEQCWGTKSGATGLSADCTLELPAEALVTCGDLTLLANDGKNTRPTGTTGETGDDDGKCETGDSVRGCDCAGCMLSWCRLALAAFAVYTGDGEWLRKPGATFEGAGKGSDADVIKGTSPFTAAGWVSARLLEDRREWNNTGGLWSAVAGEMVEYNPAGSLECRDRVGVECEGTGGESENRWTSWDAASAFFDNRPMGNGEGVDTAMGGLHCSDTHCTCPGGLVCNPAGDGDPELNLSKPRPRLWPAWAAINQSINQLPHYKLNKKCHS